MNVFLFDYIRGKVKFKVLAYVFYPFAKLMILIMYNLKKLFSHYFLNISTDEAYEKVNSVHKKPINSYELNDSILAESIDLSIIVPAYNVEQYVEDCIDSIISQKTRYSYELILVNDGSTDNTYSIIKKYEKNKNVIIINQANKGLAGARNSGIDIARGKYLTFVDSDDRLTENAIEVLLDAAFENDASIVQGAYYTFINDFNDKELHPIKKQVLTNQELDEIMKYPGFAWGKLYEAGLFKDVRYPVNYWYEDTISNYLLFRKCEKFVSIPNCIYGYRINPDGITNQSQYSVRCIDTYWIVEEMLEISRRIGLENDKSIYRFTLRQLSQMLNARIFRLEEEVKMNIFILACNIIDEMYFENVKMPAIYKDIQKSFIKKDYGLWKLSSKYVGFI